MAKKEDLFEGQEVRVYDKNGTRAGQPLGGWAGTITKVKRDYVTVWYDRSQRLSEFRIDSQYTKDGFRYFRTLEEVELADRQTHVRGVLIAHGLRTDIPCTVPLGKLERIVEILEEDR